MQHLKKCVYKKIYQRKSPILNGANLLESPLFCSCLNLPDPKNFHIGYHVTSGDYPSTKHSIKGADIAIFKTAILLKMFIYFTYF